MHVRRSWFLAIVLLGPWIVVRGGVSDEFDGGPGGTGTDWFTAANWSSDSVPTSSVEAIINGFDVTALVADSGGSSIATNQLGISNGFPGNTGFTGLLTSDVDIGDGSYSINISVGYTGGPDNTVTGNYVGTLTQNNADIQLASGSISVGVNFKTPNAAANGTFQMTNGTLSNGSMDIGVVFDGGAAATGLMQLTGVSFDTGSVFVGAAANPVGSANGTLSADSSTLSIGPLCIGGLVFDSPPATSPTVSGTVKLTNSELDVGPGGITIGMVANAPVSSATGELELDASFVQTESLVLLNDVSTLTFHVDGTQRAAAGNVSGPSLYGAMDILATHSDMAKLGGELEVLFGFTPTLGDTFDLISITNAGINFHGSFAGVTFSGLSNDLDAQWQIVPSTGSSGEIFRVSIVAGAAIPEPSSLPLLMLLGIASLRRSRRRHRAGCLAQSHA